MLNFLFPASSLFRLRHAGVAFLLRTPIGENRLLSFSSFFVLSSLET